MTDMFILVKNCYIAQVLNDDQANLLEKPTESYETYEKVDYGWVVVGMNERKRCSDVHWFIFRVQTEI